MYTDIDDREITKIVKDLIEEFPSCGEIMLGHILQQKNIKVSLCVCVCVWVREREEVVCVLCGFGVGILIWYKICKSLHAS